MLIVYRNALLSYISRLKSRRKLPPGKEKMGFALRLGGAIPSGFYHKQLMLGEPFLLLASIGFVIESRLPLIRPLSLASIAFVMTGVLARLSISLSKHCDLVPNCLMPAVVHSQQASHFGYPNPDCEGRSSPKTPLLF